MGHVQRPLRAGRGEEGAADEVWLQPVLADLGQGGGKSTAGPLALTPRGCSRRSGKIMASLSWGGDSQGLQQSCVIGEVGMSARSAVREVCRIAPRSAMIGHGRLGIGHRGSPSSGESGPIEFLDTTGSRSLDVFTKQGQCLTRYLV